MGGAGENVGLRKRHREICSDIQRCRLSQPLILVVGLGSQQTCRCDGFPPASCVAGLADDHPNCPPGYQLLVGRSHTPVLGTEGNVDRARLRTSRLEVLPQGNISSFHY